MTSGATYRQPVRRGQAVCILKCGLVVDEQVGVALHRIYVGLRRVEDLSYGRLIPGWYRQRSELINLRLQVGDQRAGHEDPHLGRWGLPPVPYVGAKRLIVRGL